MRKLKKDGGEGANEITCGVVSMLRKKVLNHISELEKICRACPLTADWERINYCISKCELRHEFQRTGYLLDRIANRKSRQILRKGKDMTTQDMVYLIERGHAKREIGRAMGYGQTKSLMAFRDIQPRGTDRARRR